MRILIMSDMEGVSGVVTWSQVMGGRPMYEEGRRLYTEEINAAVRGAFSGGASEVVVVDCHGAGDDWSFNSLIPELLDERCEWVAHHPWGAYTEMFASGCDGCLLIGMHARAGTPDGVMCHTISTTRWRSLRFNEHEVGEVGINAALCGHYGVPILLVTGDAATCRESAELLGPGLRTLAVKRGLSRYSARQIPPLRARRLIESAACEAVRSGAGAMPYRPAAPATIRIELDTVDKADVFRRRNGVEVVEPLEVISRGATWKAAWDQIWPC
jgi:D-amino peptidase